MSLEQALCALWNEFTPGHAGYRVLVLGKPRALKPAVEEQIYQVGREAVLNALRHSGAAIIEIDVEYSARRLRVVVRDNGSGMDPQVVRSKRHPHWGLLGMREWAAIVGAQLRVWSRLGGGTEVEICCPTETNTRLLMSSPLLGLIGPNLGPTDSLKTRLLVGKVASNQCLTYTATCPVVILLGATYRFSTRLFQFLCQSLGNSGL